MKLSEINPEEVQIEEVEAPAAAPLRLSDLSPDEVQIDDPGFGPTADGKMRNPLEVDWLGAIKNEFTKPLDPSAKAALANPMTQMLAGEAAGPLIGAGARAVGNFATRLATSPIPKKIADATNMVGKVKGIASNLAGEFSESMGPRSKQVVDFISGLAGRKAAYAIPGSNFAQGVSDTARGVEVAQKGLVWVLDNAPQKLGKYAGVLKKAAQAGPAAMATTNFLLQQSDPEYQRVLKENANQ